LADYVVAFSEYKAAIELDDRFVSALGVMPGLLVVQNWIAPSMTTSSKVRPE